MDTMSQSHCSCPHHKVVPLMALLIGVLFLLHAFAYVSDHVTDVLWPVFVIVAAGTKLMGRKCTCCQTPRVG